MIKSLMRNTVLFLFVLFFANRLSAQEDSVVRVPDNDRIRYETLDSSSPYYYPNLYYRYCEGDTTLTLEDYRHLYYGFVWQPEYKPFETPLAHDKILMILESDSLGEADFQEIIRLGKEAMEREPFDPSLVNFLVYAYGSIGDTLNERINYYRLEGILDAIRSSGTGLSEKSPWHIIYFSHVNDFLASANIRCKKEQIISRSVAYLPVLVKQKGVKGYYFDFSRIYMKRPEKEPEKRSTGWEFNGIPLKKRVAPTVIKTE